MKQDIYYIKFLVPIYTSILTLATLIIYLYQYTYNGNYIGDLGDTKAILAIMENFYQKFSTKSFEFSNTPILYPFKNVTFFTETMWLVSAIYSIVRFFNESAFVSLNQTFAIIILINFFVSFFICKKIQLSWESSCICSLIFSIGLPIVAQDSHLHLFLRAPFILALYYLIQFINSYSQKHLFAYIFFQFLIFFISIYLAVFSFLIFCVVIIIKRKSISKLKIILILKDKSASGIFFKVLIISLCLVLLIYLFQFHLISRELGFKRGYPSASLISIGSFFTTLRSPFWQFNFLPKGDPLHEEQLYIGISMTIVWIYSYFNSSNSSRNENSYKLITNYSILIFFGIYDVSIYFFISLIPGLDFISVVCRSFLLIMFPLGVYLGFFLDRHKNNLAVTLKVVAIFLLCFEISFSSKKVSNIEVNQNEINKIFLSMGELNQESIYVFRNTFNNQKDISYEAKVTLLSAIYQFNTMNGFTSFIPRNFGKYETCKDVYDALQFIYDKYDKSYMYEIDNRNIIFIGFDHNCKKVNN